MFGTYRFVLALLVAIEHMRLVKEIHVGVLAVIGFYILAGYVMTHSFAVNFSLDLRKVPNFYVDRFLRIFPSYWVACCWVLLFFLIAAPQSIILKFSNFLINFTLLPLNFFMFIGDPNYFLINPNGIPVPPAPSLALELQFYLIFPFLLYSRKWLYVVFPVSFLIFCLALLNVINPYFYGYLLIPGMLSIFLIGSLLHRILHGIEMRISRFYFWGSVLILLAMWVCSALTKFHFQNFEVLTGVFISIIAITVLSKVKTPSRVDSFLGNLSYPIFLLHWSSIWISSYLFSWLPGVIPEILKVAIQLILTVFLSSACYYLVDVGVQKWRKNIQLGATTVRRRGTTVSEMGEKCRGT